jgi:hypothetical protein
MCASISERILTHPISKTVAEVGVVSRAVVQPKRAIHGKNKCDVVRRVFNVISGIERWREGGCL